MSPRYDYEKEKRESVEFLKKLLGSVGPATGSRPLSKVFHSLERGEPVSLQERLDAAKFLLAEVMQWHADIQSPDYNQCEKAEERCHWCANAALVIGENNQADRPC